MHIAMDNVIPFIFHHFPISIQLQHRQLLNRVLFVNQKNFVSLLLV
ncbi:hypothetical protein B4U80_04953 [Leptotrombidium deliense]|uniref:Uncharacterized protein n=1 Tax=Leptotrombidium deliense TaxID=299467 RepID=A0A443SJE5_9ACAR|nr:hypothetical protein B4U80_04953 [Leptotrombidium deliense]